MSNLPCLNCQKDVDPDKGKLYLGCFLCPDCYTIAERLHARGEQELRWILTVLQELIRLAIVGHKLQLNLDEGEQSKSEVLQELANLVRQNGDGQCQTLKTTPSPTTT
jgi:hypothetical protein